VTAALLFSALMLGLAGIPHCTAMCAAPCAAATGGGAAGRSARIWTFHAFRIVAYAAGGALAASSVGALALAVQWSPVFKPLWTLLHAGALVLGLWLAWTGRQPQWLENLGRGSARAVPAAGGWRRIQGPGRAALAGSLWLAWPCGLLQSALLLAALANGAAAGAVVMAGFAAVTATGLVLGPRLWSWLGGPAVAARAADWGVRLAGAALAGAAAWALSHDLWARFIAYCFG
jgi:sulfite exporter TauE/SafE